MAKQANAWIMQKKKKWSLMVLALFSLSTAMVFLMRSAFDSCNANRNSRFEEGSAEAAVRVVRSNAGPNPLQFMKSKLVLLVSHELSLSGGPLLLMELAFLLRGVGAEVVWVTSQKPPESDEVIYSLENKMLDRGVQARYAFAQALGSRNASKYGPDDGSSGGPALTGPRSNGMGRSNWMVVEVAESSSILFGSEVAIVRVLRKLGESEFEDSRLILCSVAHIYRGSYRHIDTSLLPTKYSSL